MEGAEGGEDAAPWSSRHGWVRIRLRFALRPDMDLRVLLSFFYLRVHQAPRATDSVCASSWALFYFFFFTAPLSCVTNHVEFIILSADYDRTTFHFQQLLSAHTSPVPSDVYVAPPTQKESIPTQKMLLCGVFLVALYFFCGILKILT